MGLGNPGETYRETRHNLGFRVIEGLRRRLGSGSEIEACGALVSETETAILARPQTYMNRSGWSVRCLADRYGLASSEVLVIFDDVALPLGKLRARARGGPGGHRGMESIVEAMRTSELARLRLGIAPPEATVIARSAAEADLAEFVLAPFSEAEIPLVEPMVELAVDAAACWLDVGIDATMNRFNP